MSIRPLVGSYANTNLNAAVTLLNAAGTGAIAVVSQHQRVRIAADIAAVWVKLSAGDVVVATAGTASEILIPIGGVETFEMGDDWDNLSIINDAANCNVSATLVDA